MTERTDFDRVVAECREHLKTTIRRTLQELDEEAEQAGLTFQEKLLVAAKLADMWRYPA